MMVSLPGRASPRLCKASLPFKQPPLPPPEGSDFPALSLAPSQSRSRKVNTSAQQLRHNKQTADQEGLAGNY